MRMLISFAALFLSVIFVQLGSGGVAPLDAISGLGQGFSKGEVGMLGSAHFIGFFIGCWWAPRMLGTVGHSRAFAAFSALGTIGIAAHMMLVNPLAWSIMRMLTGLSVAGCYTIIEAWLQSSVTNETRGRAMGVYRVVDVGASLGAQLMIGVLTPSSYASYNLLAIACCAALLPLALTRTPEPVTPAAPRLRPAMAWARSPLAAAGVVVTGITGAAFRFVGPVYASEVGLTLDQIAVFLAVYVLGGWVAQLPVGWLADRFDRRWVLIGLSLAAIGAAAMTVAMAGAGSMAIYIAAGLFGFVTLPIYSVSAAHAHDHATSSERVELSAALMFLYAVGAIASPLAASLLIDGFGPASMFWAIALVHLVLVVFGFWRMALRPGPRRRLPYTWVPRTTFQVGRLFRRGRDD
ncbi:MFS transporter [Phaeovulum sp.]|uniref:MFS transporter n=1 Tax=Phaeovulum sp. TaxID=2934796 RepID=UPI003562D61B